MNSAAPIPFDKPKQGAKTFAPANHSGQVGLEQCLLRANVDDEWSDPTVVRPLTHSWYTKFVPTCAGKSALSPSVLLDERTDYVYLGLTELAGRAIYAALMRPHNNCLRVVHPCRYEYLIITDISAAGIYKAIPVDVEMLRGDGGYETVYHNGTIGAVPILQHACATALSHVYGVTMTECFNDNIWEMPALRYEHVCAPAVYKYINYKYIYIYI